jgi:bacterioferritin-associated ferredoxin
MDLQLIFVILLFILALIYLGRMVYKSVNNEKGCASNCGKCAADFSDVKISDSGKH